MKAIINGKEIHNRDDVYEALDCAGRYAGIEYHDMTRMEVDKFHAVCSNDVVRYVDANGKSDTFASYSIEIEDEESNDGFLHTIEYFTEKAVDKICGCLIRDGFIFEPEKNEDGVLIDFKKCDKIFKHFQNRYAQKTFKGEMLWKGSAREASAALYSRYIIGDITDEERLFIFGRICNSALYGCYGDFWRV